jgi:hypothetical protein
MTERSTHQKSDNNSALYIGVQVSTPCHSLYNQRLWWVFSVLQANSELVHEVGYAVG